MDAKCPECLGKKDDCPKCEGSGFIEVGFASGDLYSSDCDTCKRNIGGCIVGPNGLKEVPPPKPCWVCGNGMIVFTKVGEV